MINSMDGADRKRELLETTMKLAARTGLEAFPLKQVTKEAGVSEALLFRYFENREVLLYSCFESVHMQIAELFENMEMRKFTTQSELFFFIRNGWENYFNFLVKNDYRTIFYFEYRDSAHMRNILQNDEEARSTYFKNFVDMVQMARNEYQGLNSIDQRFLWTYLLDTTGIFAKRMIRGELPNTPESRNIIWSLLVGGLNGLLQPI